MGNGSVGIVDEGNKYYNIFKDIYSFIRMYFLCTIKYELIGTFSYVIKDYI